MLQVKRGDVLREARNDCILIHGCNAQGRMKSGFAEKLRNIYPQAYQAYKKVEAAEGLKLGEVSIVRFMNGLIIGNAVTQEFYGRDSNVVYVDYDAVEKALTSAAGHAKKHGLSVHLPFIGGGLANGDRDKLMVIFERVFHDVEATLWLHEDEEVANHIQK